MYRIFNQGQQTPKEPMAFKGFDKDNAYVFQAPTSGIVHRLSSRAFRDVVEGNTRAPTKVRVKGELLDLYPQTELQKAITRPNQVKRLP